MSVRSGIIRILGRLCIALGFAFAAYMLVFRPLQMNRGATEEEINRAMPGDDIVQYPDFNATRGVTVQASPEQIWPWLVQIGHTRAGWYSYDLVDNLAKPSAEKIVPEWQNLQIGDLVPISPDGKYGFRVKDFEVNKWMLWWDNEGDLSWLWFFSPLEDGTTRLITRLKMDYNWKFPLLFFDLLIDVGDFVMMRQCMLGIKDRAEGQPAESFIVLTAEFFLWIIAFTGFIIAEVRIIIRKNCLLPLMMAVAACSVTLLLVFWKPPVLVDLFITVGIYAGLWWESRTAKVTT